MKRHRCKVQNAAHAGADERVSNLLGAAGGNGDYADPGWMVDASALTPEAQLEIVEQQKLLGQLVETLLQDGLCGSVPGVVIVQGTFAGCLQAFFPEPFAQGDDSLCSSQVIQHPVSEKDVKEFFAVRSDAAGLFEAPLGILHLVGYGLGGKMFVHGGAKPGSFQPGMDGHQLEIVEKFYVALRGLQPQLLADELEGSRVKGLLELDRAVAMDGDLGPGGQLRRHIRQG